VMIIPYLIIVYFGKAFIDRKIVNKNAE